MPLRFDPASLMAPGGIVSGLDDLGSAVMNAMNRRAERRYANEREAKKRGEYLADVADTRTYEEKLRGIKRGESKADLEEQRGYNEKRDARGVVLKSGAAYSPDMETGDQSLYGNIEDAEAGGVIGSSEAAATKAQRLAAKAAYELSLGRIAKPSTGAQQQQIKAPPARSTVSKAGKSTLDTETRIADLTETAIRADAAGKPEQAKALRDQVDALVQLKGLQAPVPTDADAEVGRTTFDELWSQGGLEKLFQKDNDPTKPGIPRPKKDAAYNSRDIFDYQPGVGTITHKGRPDWIDDVDENYFDVDAETRMKPVQDLVTAYHTSKKQKILDQNAAAKAAHDAKRAKLFSALDGETAQVLNGGPARSAAAAATLDGGQEMDPKSAFIQDAISKHPELKAWYDALPEGSDIDEIVAEIQKSLGSLTATE
jgi:hypothetical protein